MKASERHNLKHDKAADAVAHAVEWVREHKNPLLIGLAVVLLVCAGVVFLTLSSQNEERAAAALLTAADSKAQLIRYLRRETDEKIVAEAVAAYEVVARNHPKSKAAPLAVLSAAQVLMQTGRADQAGAFFRRVLIMAPGKSGLVALAHRGLAESLEESGKIEEAVAHYSALLEVVAADAKAQVYWDIGRCYGELGQTEKAIENLKNVVTNAPDSNWAKLAQSGIDNPQSLAYVASAPLPEAPMGPPGPIIDVSSMPPLPEIEEMVTPDEDTAPLVEDTTPPTEDSVPPAQDTTPEVDE